MLALLKHFLPYLIYRVILVDEYGCLRGVVSMEDVIETMTGVEIVDEDDVAVDMQAFAKEKSRMMLKK